MEGGKIRSSPVESEVRSSVHLTWRGGTKKKKKDGKSEKQSIREQLITFPSDGIFNFSFHRVADHKTLRCNAVFDRLNSISFYIEGVDDLFISTLAACRRFGKIIVDLIVTRGILN